MAPETQKQAIDVIPPVVCRFAGPQGLVCCFRPCSHFGKLNRLTPPYSGSFQTPRIRSRLIGFGLRCDTRQNVGLVLKKTNASGRLLRLITHLVPRRLQLLFSPTGLCEVQDPVSRYTITFLSIPSVNPQYSLLNTKRTHLPMQDIVDTISPTLEITATVLIDNSFQLPY